MDDEEKNARENLQENLKEDLQVNLQGNFQENPLAGRLEDAAGALLADPGIVDAGSAEASLLRYLGYDDGETAHAEARSRLLRAAARLRRLFLLPVPDAPGLIFFGGEADPAMLGKSCKSLPIGNLAGSGLMPQRAFESCVGEGVEYLSQFLNSDDHVERGPLTRCGDASDADVRRFIEETLAICSVDSDRPIAWVSADRLSDGARLRFPLDLCYRRRASEQDFTPPLKLSSGCAAGVSVEAATLRALLELVERDAAALWWRGGRRARPIAPHSEAPHAAAELLAQLRQGKTDRKTWLLDITTDVGIPVVVALSGRADGFGFAYGFGARLNLAEAARSAVFELCQVELGQHVIEAKRRESGDGALNESDRKQWRRGTAFDTRTCQLLQPETGLGEISALGGISANSPDVALSSLQQALERLEARGIATYRINLTRPAFGIPVVRVLAPALQLEPCQIVGPRLARTIAQTGGGAVHHGGMPLL
jgi:ribosomal protein S12 methylthiotransferase accessory factor